jgi:hypothetical protein
MSVPALLPCESVERCVVRVNGRFWTVIGDEIQPDGTRQPFTTFWNTSADAQREAKAIDRQNAERARMLLQGCR